MGARAGPTSSDLGHFPHLSQSDPSSPVHSGACGVVGWSSELWRWAACQLGLGSPPHFPGATSLWGGCLARLLRPSPAEAPWAAVLVSQLLLSFGGTPNAGLQAQPPHLAILARCHCPTQGDLEKPLFFLLARDPGHRGLGGLLPPAPVPTHRGACSLQLMLFLPLHR